MKYNNCVKIKDVIDFCTCLEQYMNIGVLMSRLFDKHKQFEQSQHDKAHLQEHIDHLNKTMDDLQQVIREKDAEINRSVSLLPLITTVMSFVLGLYYDRRWRILS